MPNASTLPVVCELLLSRPMLAHEKNDISVLVKIFEIPTQAANANALFFAKYVKNSAHKQA